MTPELFDVLLPFKEAWRNATVMPTPGGRYTSIDLFRRTFSELLHCKYIAFFAAMETSAPLPLRVMSLPCVANCHGLHFYAMREERISAAELIEWLHRPSAWDGPKELELSELHMEANDRANFVDMLKKVRMRIARS